MKHIKFSLMYKISGIVFIAFAIVLGNEIRLGIDRYMKNTLETDAAATIRNLDKFSKSYVETIAIHEVDLSSNQFQKIYKKALVGDSSQIKCLVDAKGKILNISREGIHYPNISFVLDEYLGAQNWPAYLDLSILSEQERSQLEKKLQEDPEGQKILTFEGDLGKCDEYYANEFKNIKLKTLKLNDEVIAEREYEGEAETLSGPVNTYVSYNVEMLFSVNNSEAVKNSQISSLRSESQNAMLVLDYHDAMKGLQYQIQKNFQKFKSSAKSVAFGDYDYGQYYLLKPYKYQDKYYSTIMVRLEDWSLLNVDDEEIDLTSQEVIEQITVGYIFVTKEYKSLVFNAFKQFTVDNSSTYFLAFLLILLSCISIGYMIIKPIRRIEITAKHISRKEFDYPIDITRHDELGDLSRSIDKMSKELERTINSLHQEIDRVQKLEGMRKEFVSNFTHEIKTPLGIINGFSELVELEQDEQKRNEYIGIIQSETQQINRLVLAMLDLYKLESQNVAVNLEEIDLLDIVDDGLDSMNYLIEKKNISLVTSLTSASLKADRFKIEMVINNFISNALRYTEDGKKISIVLDEHHFSIENEGAHIPEEDMEKIWLTFHKVDKSRNAPGTGLGLAICKAILDLHHFDYGVENTKTGVLFYFRFKE